MFLVPIFFYILVLIFHSKVLSLALRYLQKMYHILYVFYKLILFPFYLILFINLVPLVGFEPTFFIIHYVTLVSKTRTIQGHFAEDRVIETHT